MSEKRVTRQYEVEFKLDAVRLVEEQGYSVPEAAQRLGIPKSNLSNWRRQYRAGRLVPGHPRTQPPPEEAELRQLRAEIKRLEVVPALAGVLVDLTDGERDPKKGERVLREEPKVRFAFIAEHQHLYPVRVLCGVMKVSRSGFYDYLTRVGRGPTAREREDGVLTEQIKAIFEENRRRYGSPRIHAELRKRQVVCSLRRVKRLMRQAGLYALPKRTYKRRKTPEVPLETVNLLAPKPTIVTANQIWYSDITFVKTAEGWLYLAAVMDAYSKRIVGYAMNDTMKTDLVIQALRMATRQRHAPTGLIHHSDKGSQYTSYTYQRELAAWGMRSSFTQVKGYARCTLRAYLCTGACLDNAHIESFFATLKKELVYQTTFATREEARLAIFEFIEGYYNRCRLHSSLGYQSPTHFEAQGLERLAA